MYILTDYSDITKFFSTLEKLLLLFLLVNAQALINEAIGTVNTIPKVPAIP